MKGYFRISESSIILSSITHDPWGNHRYIVYVNENSKIIRVNTYYEKINEAEYECYIYYDKPLCNTIDELRKMTIDEIERQAYCAWMDGAK